MRTRLIGTVAVTALIGVACAQVAPAPPTATPPPAPPTTTPPGAVPVGLPTHFSVGLSASPPDLATSGWVGQSGIPFDFAYQYLAGGVSNTWQSWNTNATFPLLYAQSAKARSAIPVFPYYMLLQSHHCGGCGEAQDDLANLNSASLMAAYYADFAKLMQRLGPGTYDTVHGYGGVAVVHVDPDLSGYAEQAVLAPSANCYGHCTGTGNSPTLLQASVASSGVPEIAAYANDFRGFNLALLHLRDLYAPNVKLAFHVSDWAALRDVGSDPDTTLDPVALGNLAGAFAAASGVSSAPAGTSTYDLVFNDVSDRDAGYYKYVVGRPNVWWDKLNVAVPNFARWEQYLGAVTAATGRRAIVWQIPLGNQWFTTENNTDGHYQDNRAEYFFAHVSELTNIGVIGLLFGKGNAGSTTNTDFKNDGTTNPAQTCTSDGLSTGAICSNHTPTVSDDDGGYLRMASGSYFGSPVMLP